MLSKKALPVVNMGGLRHFEIACRTSAPAFIEVLIQLGSDHPERPLPAEMLGQLVELLTYCLGGDLTAKRRAIRLVKRQPDLVACALRGFLEDPLPAKRKSSSSGAADPVELPTVLDMRASWIAAGHAPDVFDGLTLWEHGRILQQQEIRQRAALADAAVAARISQAEDQKFRRFMGEMTGGGTAKTPREWAEHLFKATAHLPKLTQQDLASLKGQA